MNAANNTRNIRTAKGHTDNYLSHVGRRTYSSRVCDQNRGQLALQRGGNRKASFELTREDASQPIGKAPLMQGLTLPNLVRTAVVILALLVCTYMDAIGEWLL